MTAPLNILLIGFGNMGRALYQGWHSQNHIIVVVDPMIDAGKNRFKTVTDEVRSFKPDLIVLAVKPQILDKVLVDYAYLKNTQSHVLSIMGGKTLSTLSTFFGAETPVTRSMPNTPAMVGQGITACVSNLHVTQEHKSQIDTLLNVVGHVVWIDDEEHMHAVTAVSASGPAYIFHLIEAMAAAGVEVGLPEGLAVKLAHQTVVGSAALAAQSDEDAATLRARVTSPGGTTEAALNVLMKDSNGLKKLMTQAILKAAQRSRDLS